MGARENEWGTSAGLCLMSVDAGGGPNPPLLTMADGAAIRTTPTDMQAAVTPAAITGSGLGICLADASTRVEGDASFGDNRGAG